MQTSLAAHEPIEPTEASYLHLSTVLTLVALETVLIACGMVHWCRVDNLLHLSDRFSDLGWLCLAQGLLLLVAVVIRAPKRPLKDLRFLVGMFLVIDGTLTAYASQTLATTLLGLSSPVYVSGDGLELRLRGNIPENLADDVRRACSQQHCARVERVNLDSSGGNVDGAFSGAEALRSLGVHKSTVTNQCSSACVALWSSIDEAELPAGTILGLHNFYNSNTHKPDADSEWKKRRVIELLVAQGISRDIAEKGERFPSDRLYFIGAGDLDEMRKSRQESAGRSG